MWYGCCWQRKGHYTSTHETGLAWKCRNVAQLCCQMRWLHLDECRISFLKDKEEKEGRKECKREGKNRRRKEPQAFDLKTGRLERRSVKDNVFNN